MTQINNSYVDPFSRLEAQNVGHVNLKGSRKLKDDDDYDLIILN